MFYYDGKVLRIMNYQKIHSLDDTKIEVAFPDSHLTVTGEGLKIIYLEPRELHLTGTIRVIEKALTHETA